MQEIIERVYQDKLNDGTIEKIVGQRIEIMVSDVLDDIMGWNGEVRKKFKERLEPLVNNAVECSSLDDMTVKLTAVIDEGLKNSEVAMYKGLLDGVKSLCQPIGVTPNQKIKVSEIFRKYVDYVSDALDESDFDADEISTDDGEKTAYVTCYVEVESRKKENFWGTRKEWSVELSNSKGDNANYTLTNMAFDIREDYDGKLRVRTNFNVNIGKLAYTPSFVVYLLALENRFAEIEIDETCENTDAVLEFLE